MLSSRFLLDIEMMMMVMNSMAALKNLKNLAVIAGPAPPPPLPIPSSNININNNPNNKPANLKPNKCYKRYGLLHYAYLIRRTGPVIFLSRYLI